MSAWKKILEKVHFKPENGLVFCKNPKFEHIGELYHIREKAEKLGADAVLFRRKYNKNNDVTDSKPVLYIYNEKDNLHIDSDKHKKLHAKIWSAGDIEVYFILSKTRIDIFNARKPAEVTNEKGLSLKSLCLVTEALEKFNDQRFSAIVFGKGVFWEQEDFFDSKKDKKFFRNQLSEEDAPFHRLLEYLMIARENLKAKHPVILSETIDKLLIICILIKFLEGIKGDNGRHTLKDIYARYKVKSENFEEALEKGLCIPILGELACEFKGKIFDLSDDEKQQIKQADLESVAAFLTAKLDITKKHKQRFLWEQYSFNHLPVELISSIYENFLQKENNKKEKGVVYTPPFLVNFLVDEVMPLDKPSDDYFDKDNLKFRVLDPSCGSGVFLVAAYKRMLQWWSINHYKKTNEIKFPGKKVCQRILEDNIWGVDIHETATLITIFSLTIALLDKLEPKEIWNDLKINSLQDNIQDKNFFEWAVVAKAEGKKFDLVIGNPPFNPKSGTKNKEAVSDDQIQQFGICSKDIPDNNLALKFFEGAMFFGKKVCLILPSSILLYNKSKTANKYRNCIFAKYTIEKIFDFTHLREVLFVKKNAHKKAGRTPVCAVVATPTESNGKNIEHTVVKRLVSSEKKIAFEIDHYDRHWVRHDWATDETKQFIWKTNLLGGGRLFHLIYRLSLLPTLKNFVDSKDNWKETRGFESGTKLILENQDRIIGITENGEPIIEKNVAICSDNLKDRFMYEPPFMIIDQVIGNNSLAACFISKNNTFIQQSHLYYNRDFVGISVPQEDENILKSLYKFMRFIKIDKQLNYQLFAVCISSNCLILHETAIRKGDILSLPYYPNNHEYLQLSETEKILQHDVLEYYIHLGKAISEKGVGRKLHKEVSKEQLEKFGKTFCDILNPIYAKNGKSWQLGKFYQTESFTICQFGYGKNQGLSFQMLGNLDDIVKPLVYDNTSNRGAIFTRVCRYYKHLSGYDCVFLIKPNAIRYWLNSIALRDADETFMDLKKAGR